MDLSFQNFEKYVVNNTRILISNISNNKTIFNQNISDENIIKIKNILNHEEKLINKKINNIERDMYYSLIRDNKKIYTQEYKNINTFIINDFVFHITICEEITQYENTFPNLKEYHYSEKIIQEIYDFYNYIIIFENNKIYIDIKNIKDLKNIYNLLLTIFN
jgi:hypothetical protein